MSWVHLLVPDTHETQGCVLCQLCKVWVCLSGASGPWVCNGLFPGPSQGVGGARSVTRGGERGQSGHET